MSATPPAANVIQLPPVPGKTQQRIQMLLSILQRKPQRAYTYAELQELTGTPYDQLLYCLHTLEAVSMVQRTDLVEGPGRPKVAFQWVEARAGGARLASAR